MLRDGAMPDAEICPACGRLNECGMAKGETECWCFALPHVLPVNAADRGVGCYCRTCLARAIAHGEARKIEERGRVD